MANGTEEKEAAMDEERGREREAGRTGVSSNLYVQ